MVTLKKAIQELAKGNYFFEKIYILSSLDEQSEAILGDNIGKHCEFSEFKEGTLYIECDDYMWANELKMLKRQLKKKIREKLNFDIKDINIIVVDSR
ncbi:MAG TPA: DUF721 domain-containing protein [Fervidobacterium sp.]|nr:DUF721 domain-containing protein [Fervidobacterium sp.]HOK87865.1 DUF721 domain-containing protein [Fervidobacterium sp.]HOM74411.1 DUF721 domain-containing protein [Fervidobacterium sp.]HOQ39719.1 DUF721 domain-containing protein [Fervidobacterium sp.]HPP18269.1 DUF721 domain-containing protein [Fervidobacterium sp.]